MPIFQYQKGPTVPFLSSTLPVGVSGMAWFQNFDVPFFPPRVPVAQMQTEMHVKRAINLQAALSGQPYNAPWEPPRFQPFWPHQHQTQMYSSWGLIKNASISGNAWMLPTWEQYIAKASPAHQSPATVFIPYPFGPAQLSGMPWWKDWEPPFFRGYPPEKQQTEFFLETKEYLPPIVASMWLKQWEPPFFPTITKVFQQPFKNDFIPIPATLPVGIKGMAWYMNFDIPKQVRVPVEEQSFSFFLETNTTLPQPSAYGYIIEF